MNSASSMTAMVIRATGGPDVLEHAELDVPERAIGEVLVRVDAASVNPIDAKTRAGKGSARFIREFPAVLGVDFCGTVVAPVYDVHEFQPGDRVYGMLPVPRTSGSYAQYTTAPVTSIALAPERLSALESAAVPCAALTAWGCIVDVGAIRAGDRVLIHAGAGGVGHFAVQLARRAGAHVVTTASARNADWLRELGADEVIDYRATRFEDEVGDIDVVVDLIGNVRDDTGSRSLTVMKPGGLIINVPTHSWPTFREEADAAGMRATDIKAISSTETLTEIAGLLDAGELTVHIDREFPLADVADAHRLIEEGHTRGKIVLRVD